ncbi:MAG: hypothetical protein AB7L90_26735 [Hyphomicrobiaceae bacterium]
MDGDHFFPFLQSRRLALRRISRATRGEASLEDVESEAWLMMTKLQSKGLAVDLRNPEHQSLLLAHLYQHLVRYTETKVRHGVRLDYAPGGEEGAHPLANILAAEEGSDPLVTLMRLQEERQATEDVRLSPHQSLASAYVYLLERMDNRMTALADYLLISLSYCYRRCAQARVMAEYQQTLPQAAMTTTRAFVPKTWRPFRLVRQPVQLCFDFERRLFSDTSR